jgi:hypothetical protein
MLVSRITKLLIQTSLQMTYCLCKFITRPAQDGILYIASRNPDRMEHSLNLEVLQPLSIIDIHYWLTVGR